MHPVKWNIHYLGPMALAAPYLSSEWVLPQTKPHSPSSQARVKSERQAKGMWYWDRNVQAQNLIIKKGSRVSKPSSCAGEKQDCISQHLIASWAGRSFFHHSQPSPHPYILCSTAAAKLLSKVVNNTQSSCVADPKHIKVIITSTTSLLLQHDVTFQCVDCPHHWWMSQALGGSKLQQVL